MNNGHFIKELVTIALVFLVLDLALYFGLSAYYKKKFDQGKLEQMMVKNSKFKEITDNPCKWSITGDPWGTELTFIKLNLYCSKNESVTNTLDLKGIKGRTYGDLLKEYASIQGVSSLKISDEGKIDSIGSLANNSDVSWSCFINRNLNSNMNDYFKARDQVDCFYADTQEIKRIINEFSKMK